MSNTIRLHVILILVATFILGLDFSKGFIGPISEAGAAGSAANCSQQNSSSDYYWPPHNSSIYDNKPCFRWPESYNVAEFEIQISRDPSFRDQSSTFSQMVAATSFRPGHFLGPGDWYWRIRAQYSRRWSSTGRFSQTAPEGVDTTGPEITPVVLSITSSDQPMQLTVTDPNGVESNSLAVGGIAGKSFQIANNSDLVTVRASGGWPGGAHQLRVEASDKLGNQTVKYFWVVVAPAPPKQQQWVSRQGIFDGNDYEFPLGLYHVPYESLAKAKAAGFNLVHHYGWEFYPENSGLRDYLDMLSANGLKLFLGFDRGLGSNNGLLQMNLAHLAQRVAEIRDHPALMAWYLFDEPDREQQFLPPRNLKVLYDTLKLLDPYHPVVVTISWPDNLQYYGRESYDALWIMAYHDTETNDRTISRDAAFLGPGKPFLAISSAYDEEKSSRLQQGLPYNDQDFVPDLSRMRADAYLALTHGSSGLCWWWYGDNRREYVSAGDTPDAWAWLTQVVAEIKELSPAFKEPNSDLAVQVESQGATARARAVKYGSQITIITVNPSSSQEAQVTIRSGQFPSQATAFGKFNTPQNQITNRELRVTLPPLAAYVYAVNP